MNPLTYKDLPYDWAVCFQDDCPLCQKCLRFDAAKLLPGTEQQHQMVLPNARKDGDCALFASNEPVFVARGMKHLLDGIDPWKAMPLRQELANIFGSRSHFYRYRNGDYIITPEQQERVAKLFLKYGLKRPPHYDETSNEYYFPA